MTPYGYALLCWSLGVMLPLLASDTLSLPRVPEPAEAMTGAFSGYVITTVSPGDWLAQTAGRDANGVMVVAMDGTRIFDAASYDLVRHLGPMLHPGMGPSVTLRLGDGNAVWDVTTESSWWSRRIGFEHQQLPLTEFTKPVLACRPSSTAGGILPRYHTLACAEAVRRDGLSAHRDAIRLAFQLTGLAEAEDWQGLLDAEAAAPADPRSPHNRYRSFLRRIADQRLAGYEGAHAARFGSDPAYAALHFPMPIAARHPLGQPRCDSASLVLLEELFHQDAQVDWDPFTLGMRLGQQLSRQYPEPLTEYAQRLGQALSNPRHMAHYLALSEVDAHGVIIDGGPAAEALRLIDQQLAANGPDDLLLTGRAIPLVFLGHEEQLWALIDDLLERSPMLGLRVASLADWVAHARRKRVPKTFLTALDARNRAQWIAGGTHPLVAWLIARQQEVGRWKDRMYLRGSTIARRGTTLAIMMSRELPWEETVTALRAELNTALEDPQPDAVATLLVQRLGPAAWKVGLELLREQQQRSQRSPPTAWPWGDGDYATCALAYLQANTLYPHQNAFGWGIWHEVVAPFLIPSDQRGFRAMAAATADASGDQLRDRAQHLARRHGTIPGRLLLAHRLQQAGDEQPAREVAEPAEAFLIRMHREFGNATWFFRAWHAFAMQLVPWCHGRPDYQSQAVADYRAFAAETPQVAAQCALALWALHEGRIDDAIADLAASIAAGTATEPGFVALYGLDGSVETDMRTAQLQLLTGLAGQDLSGEQRRSIIEGPLGSAFPEFCRQQWGAATDGSPAIDF
jgi:hypothetical protein